MVEGHRRHSDDNIGTIPAGPHWAGPRTEGIDLACAIQTRRQQRWRWRRPSHAPYGCSAVAPLLLLLYVSLLLMHPRLLQARGPPLPKQVTV